MRANDDVDAALSKELEDFLLLTLRPKTAEHFDTHRIIEHSLPKNLEVLLREHGCWRQHGDLATIHHRFERGANRHFRFSETNIAANQAVHRPGTFHVDLCVDDGFHLVGRLAKRERMLEFALPFCVGTERVPGNGLALGLDREHFAGVIENRRYGGLFRACPFCVRERA